MADLIKTIKHIEKHTFEGVCYENPNDLVIEGKQFTIARISSYGMCYGSSAIIKLIEENTK